MKKLNKFFLPAILLAGFLAGCDSSSDVPVTQVAPAPVVQTQPQVAQQEPQVVYEQAPQQQPQVVVVEQQPQVVYRDSHSSGITAGHVASAIGGYMIGKHLSGNNNRSFGSRRPTVVNNHYYSAPKPKRSYFGSSRRSSFGRSFGRRRR